MIKFSVKPNDIYFKVTSAKITMDIQPATVVYTGDFDKYTGGYTVTPKVWSESVLETKRKLLSDNVTVTKIPQYKVSNDYGGYTLIIGDDTME